MAIGDTKHRTSWAEEQIKNAQESIWVIEVSLLQTEKMILAKSKELERIEKRIEEKFYPSARDGKEDKQNRQMELQSFQGNRDRMNADKKRYEDQIQQVNEFMGDK